jgi:peroxiredoxin
VTVYESPAQSPTGEAFAIVSYGSSIPLPSSAEQTGDAVELPTTVAQPDARLRMYTTMATWCGSCKAEVPEQRELRGEFTNLQLAMFGVPVDAKDTTAKLQAYVEQHDPAYELLLDVSTETIDLVVELGRESLGNAGLPMTIVVDDEGRVQLVRLGTPTVSELRRLLIR